MYAVYSSFFFETEARIVLDTLSLLGLGTMPFPRSLSFPPPGSLLPRVHPRLKRLLLRAPDVNFLLLILLLIFLIP